MGFPELYQFLSELNKNNNKEWMDKHRKEYYAVRDFYISWLNKMNDKFAVIDNDYVDTTGKKAINRINNNLMFHPNKPIYKDHFSAGLDQKSKQGDFYMEFGLAETYMGGGYWHPESKVLRSIREAIDYNGEALKEILNKPSFKKMFGDLIVDKPLKTAPKGFSQEHSHIDLLRRKSFAVVHYLDRKSVYKLDFEEKVVEIYQELLPFRRYLNQAVSV